MIKVITRRYGSKVRHDTAQTTWRERLAGLLRRAATRLDGKTTLALDIRCEPPVPQAVRDDVIRQGVAHMQWCLLDAAAEEARESVLREVMPFLFAEDVAPGPVGGPT